MGKGIYVATSGAMARARSIETVANNVANAQTPGFKKVQQGFEEVLRSAQAPNRHHVAMTAPRISTEAGPMKQTGRDLDLALSGLGYFVVNDGAERSTLLRTVSLRVTDAGRLVDGQGREILTDVNEPLDPSRPVSVDTHGVIRSEDQIVGRVEVRSLFDDEGALEPIGGGAYRTTEASGTGLPIETTDVVSGALEGSNVAPVESMVALITLERDFQSLTKVIHAYREADDGLVDLARG